MMSVQKYKVLAEAGALLRFALPLAGAQLVMCLAGFVDTVMAGRYGSLDLAGVAVGYTAWIPVNVFLVGLLMAKTAFVAQLVGAGRHNEIPSLVQQGLRIAVVMGVLGSILLYLSPWLLSYTGMSEPVQAIACGYIHAVAWGMPGVAINQVLRSYMEGQGFTRSVMVIQVLSLTLNIPFNYALIYGRFGLPELGGVGCGYATALIMWLAPLLMALYIKLNSELALTSPFRALVKTDITKIMALWRVGAPIGGTLFLQFLVFTLITLLVTPLGESSLGAHQIAFNFSTLPFVIPSALGTALTIRIGQAVGANMRVEARYRGYVGMTVALILALGCALLILGLGHGVVSLYTDNRAIIVKAQQLMLLVALYHLLSGVQQVIASSLRGYKDTRKVMIIMLVSLWGIALPLGYTLARTDLLAPAMGVSGFWVGIIIAFALAVLLTYRRFRQVSSS